MKFLGFEQLLQAYLYKPKYHHKRLPVGSSIGSQPAGRSRLTTGSCTAAQMGIAMFRNKQESDLLSSVQIRHRMSSQQKKQSDTARPVLGLSVSPLRTWIGGFLRSLECSTTNRFALGMVPTLDCFGATATTKALECKTYYFDVRI
jgi:hypothetical protein